MCAPRHTRAGISHVFQAEAYIKYKQAENECRAETFVRGGASIYMQIRGCVTWPDSHFAARHYYA